MRRFHFFVSAFVNVCVCVYMNAYVCAYVRACVCILCMRFWNSHAHVKLVNKGVSVCVWWCVLAMRNCVRRGDEFSCSLVVGACFSQGGVLRLPEEQGETSAILSHMFHGMHSCWVPDVCPVDCPRARDRWCWHKVLPHHLLRHDLPHLCGVLPGLPAVGTQAGEPHVGQWNHWQAEGHSCSRLVSSELPYKEKESGKPCDELNHTHLLAHSLVTELSAISIICSVTFLTRCIWRLVDILVQEVFRAPSCRSPSFLRPGLCD